MLPVKLHLILWFIAVIVHIFLLIAAWDMFPTKLHFTPVETSYESRLTGNSKRAVIFLVGGLNASLLFTTLQNSGNWLLKQVITDKGSWGITWSSNTTSDGNLLTILSGNRNNEILFKYGEPDLITRYLERVIYIGNAHLKQIKAIDNWEVYSYPKTWSKYVSNYDDVTMDNWVYDRTKLILSNISENRTDSVNTKNLFLIYFEGLKVINKYEGKNSERSNEAIHRILKYIDDLVNSFRRVYEDEKTVFIVLSDFVPTDIKEYKDNSDEVIMPVLAWGSGISGPFSRNNLWSLQSKDRKDIRHIDIAPLIACLLGIPTPVHSVGHLPFSYLMNNYSLIARCALSNLKQLYSLCLKESEIINNKALIKLSTIMEPIELSSVKEQYGIFTENVDNERYNVVINEAETLINKLLDSVDYYRYYNARLAKIIICLLYPGWLLYLSSNMFHTVKVEDGVVTEQQKIKPSFWKRILVPSIIIKCLIDLIYAGISLALLILAILAGWPIRLIVYFVLLLCIYWAVLKYGHRWFVCKNTLVRRTDPMNGIKFVIVSLLFIILCGFYMNVILLSIITFILMLLLPYVDYRQVKNCYIGDWLLSSLLIIFFMCYGGEFITNLNGLIIQTVFFVALCFTISTILQIKVIDLPLVVLAMFAVILATITNCLIEENIINSTIWLWILSLSYVFVFIVGSNNLCLRLVQSGTCLSIPYFLTAKRYEPLTFTAILIHLFTWLTIESYKPNEEVTILMKEVPKITETKSKAVEWSDARRAFMCVLYLLITNSALGNNRNLVNIFSTIELDNILTWSPLIAYIFRLNSIVLIVTMFYVTLGKLCNSGYKIPLLCLLLILDSMAYLILLVTITMNAFTMEPSSISNYIMCQFIILTFLLTYPVNLCLTSPSLLTIVTPYIPQQIRERHVTSLPSSAAII